jgi:prefoldin beta subunit
MVEDDSCEECSGECHHNADPLAQFDDETRASIQEIQSLEQNFEQLMQQKHLFNMEINETSLALAEVEKSDGDLFKVVGGQVMIKSSKEKLTTELKHKKELLIARMKNIEEQEKEFSERIELLRQNVLSKISSNRE